MNTELRKDCPMRHECGNCLPAGGFCTAVNNPICEALHNAYDTGWRAAFFSAQQEAAGLIRALSNDDLLATLRERARCLEFDLRWLILEAVHRLERAPTAQQVAEKNEPQTNADAIRAMSDEELAEHLNDWQDWGGGLSTEMWLEWLRQPKDKEAGA